MRRPPMREIHTGAGTTFAAITASESDRRARSAFQNLVLQIASPGAALFDFGTGPGIDARFYAEHGFGVAAYDVDPEMRKYFSFHCREFIQAGQIALDGGSYQDFLSSTTVGTRREADLVTSNFAPLNLIGDLRELFAKFHALTGSGGKVLASVLSPYFIGDFKYGWWWRNSLRLWRDGHYSVQGVPSKIIRRRLADFAGQSAPHFTLTHVFPGLPPSRGRHRERRRCESWRWLCVRAAANRRPVHVSSV